MKITTQTIMFQAKVRIGIKRRLRDMGFDAELVRDLSTDQLKSLFTTARYGKR